jgi:hypothetical protein
VRDQVNTFGAQVFISAGAILALAGLLLYIFSLVTLEEYVDPPYVPRHLRSDAELLAELDFEITVDLTTEFLNPVITGRRAIDSPVRHTPVAPHWAPPIGDIRIAILDTPTAEYLFVRKSKDQLAIRAHGVPRYTSAVS